MTEIQNEIYLQVCAYVDRNGWRKVEAAEGTAIRLNISHGRDTCVTKIHHTGTIQNQAATGSRIKELMDVLKESIENPSTVVLDNLPVVIEQLPNELAQRIPNIDPVIVRYYKETILCIQANALLGATFLLGAASEKAIWLLIDAYAHAIADEQNRARFTQRVSSKSISRAYDEFKQSFNSCKSKPTDPTLTQDLDIKLDLFFQFYRLTRNDVGHPQVVPSPSKGALIANIGQFNQYIQTIYKLIDYFEQNQIVV